MPDCGLEGMPVYRRFSHMYYIVNRSGLFKYAGFQGIIIFIPVVSFKNV